MILGVLLKEVQDYAEESSLNLIIKRIDSDEPVNTVVAQYPVANTYVGRGSNLTVSISAGKRRSLRLHHRLRVFHHHHLQVLQMSKKTGD